MLNNNMNKKFYNKFLKIIQEAPELDIDPNMERDAAEMTLDDDTSMEDYDMDMEPDFNEMDDIGNAVARQNQKQASMIDSWSSKIEEFINYLNSDQSNSLLSVLAKAPDGTVLGNLKKERNKISNIASDLAALQQSIVSAKQSQ
jgi:hypothetical protein